MLIMSLVKFKMLQVRVKLSLPMPRRHTGEQRYDELIMFLNCVFMYDYVLIILGSANERVGGINAGIRAGTSLLAMKIMKLDQNVCN